MVAKSCPKRYSEDLKIITQCPFLVYEWERMYWQSRVDMYLHRSENWNELGNIKTLHDMDVYVHVTCISVNLI